MGTRLHYEGDGTWRREWSQDSASIIDLREVCAFPRILPPLNGVTRISGTVASAIDLQPMEPLTLEELLAEPTGPSKTYTEILAEHPEFKGTGVEMLAKDETRGR